MKKIKIKKKSNETITLKDFNKNIIDIINESNIIEEYNISDKKYKKEVFNSLFNVNDSRLNISDKNLKEFINSNSTVLHYSDKLINLYELSTNDIILSNNVYIISKCISNYDLELLNTLSKIIWKEFIENLDIQNSIYIDECNKILNNNFDLNYLKDKHYDLWFLIIDMLIQSNYHFKILFSNKKVENKLILNENRIEIKENIIKNLYQNILNYQNEINLEDAYKYFNINKSDKFLFVTLLIDSSINDCKSSIFLKNSKIFRTIFHEPTLKFMNDRNHKPIHNRLFILINTFYWWMINKIKPWDRYRFLLAGSIIKAAYDIRDAADVDYLILDHNDNIEEYTSLKPNIELEGLFDDFGKTYYANEEFYFPMIPEFYKKQNELKNKKEEFSKEKIIFNNYPKFSVSGLKIGRYFNIYSEMINSITDKNIDSLDTLLINYHTKIYYLGCPVIGLLYELARDHIKDIDLGRVSLKQLHDFHYINKNLRFLFSEEQIDKLKISRDYISSKKTKPLIILNNNIYHKELINKKKIGYGVLIRKCPLYMNKIIEIFIKSSPILFKDCKNKKIDFEKYYDNVLISSLPSEIKVFNEDKKIEGKYFYELDKKGKINIYLFSDSNIVFSDSIVIKGIIKININEKNQKIIKFNLDEKNLNSLFLECSNKKKYFNILANLIKNIIQFHKIIDNFTKEKIVIEYSKII